MASANAGGAIAPGTQPMRRPNPMDDPSSSEYEFHPEDPDAQYDGQLPTRLPRLPRWLLMGDTPEDNAKDVLRLRSEQLPRHYTRTEYAVLTQYLQNIFVIANWSQFAGMTFGAWRSYRNPDMWPWEMKASKNIGSGMGGNVGTGGAPGGPDGSKPPQSPFEFRSRNNPWRPPWSSTSDWWDAAKQQQQQHHQQPPPTTEGAEAASKQHAQEPQTQQQQQQQPPKLGQNKPPTEEEVRALERQLMRRVLRVNWSWGWKFATHIFFGHAIGGVLGITFAGTWVNAQENKDPRLTNYHRDRKAFLAQETQRRRSDSMERRRRAMPQSTFDGTSGSDQDGDPIGLYGNDATAQDRTPAPTPAPAPASRLPFSFGRQPQPKKPVEDELQSLGGADAGSELFWGDDKPTGSPSPSTTGRWGARDQQGQDTQAQNQTRARRTDRASTPSRAEAQAVYDSGGSAWERIRREAAEAEVGSSDEGSWSKTRRGATDRPQSKQDSFTFSDSDRSRSLAKEEAQKDFDERVERERRGEEGWK